MMKVIRMPMCSIKMRISNKNMQKLVFFLKKTVFLSSRCEKSSKFSVKNASLDKKTIVFLKELKKGYLPMHLSQFSFF